MKRRIPLFVSFFVIVSLLAARAVHADFSDTRAHKYRQAIEFMKSKNIVGGYPDGTFKPENVVNRAELLKIILESRGEPIPTATNNCGFKDVDPSAWYAKYVCFGKTQGIVKGYADGMFRPAQAVNFVEALKILQKGYNINESEGAVWYENMVKRASEDNIIPLDVNDFAMPLRRGQMAEMVTRLLKKNEGALDGYLGAKKEVRVTFDLLNQNIDLDGAFSTGKSVQDMLKWAEDLKRQSEEKRRETEEMVRQMEEGYTPPTQQELDAFMDPESWNTTPVVTTPSVKITDDVRTPPYASIDSARAASKIVSIRGGVASTTLSNGNKVFVVLPDGSAIEGASVTLLPYTAMPTGNNHPALSADYGYGVQVEIKNAQISTPGYVIFDLRGGRASEEAVQKSIFFNRCDPSRRWFNPVLCAARNGVSAVMTVDKNMAVVSPIHAKGYTDRVFFRSTIPIGIDGLLVAEIWKSDVYVPQKMSRALAETLAPLSIGNFTNDDAIVEAISFAHAWGVTFTEKQLEAISDNLMTDQSYSLRKKAILAAPSLIAAARAIPSEDPDDNWILSDLEESYQSALDAFTEDADSLTQQAPELEGMEAALTAHALAGLNVSGMDSVFATIQDNLKAIAENNRASRSDRLDALEALGLMQASGATLLPRALLISVARAGSILDDIVSDLINDILNDPSSSIRDLLRAAELAQLFGINEDAATDAAIAKSCAKLEAQLGSASSRAEFLGIAETAQQLGCDDVADKAIDEARKAPDSECDLVKKNLKNFGINECPQDQMLGD